MIQIAICDDENNTRDMLKKYCEDFFAERAEIAVETYAAGEELMKAVPKREEPFDLILLDIEMEGTDGIEVKNWLEQQCDTDILFVTSHGERMPQAFGFYVFGFLTKPVRYGDFAAEMEKLYLVLEKKKKFVTATVMHGQRKVWLRDLNYIQAERKYARFHCGKEFSDGRSDFWVMENYGYWKEELEGTEFREIKRGLLVNFANVEDVNYGEICFQRGGEKLDCSRRVARKADEILKEYRVRNAR